jgi:hypothetical protein
MIQDVLRPVRTFPTTLQKWADDSEQTKEFAETYDNAVNFETDRQLIIELQGYRTSLVKKAYFTGWEVSRDGELYLTFSLSVNNRSPFKRPVRTVKFIGYVK